MPKWATYRGTCFTGRKRNKTNHSTFEQDTSFPKALVPVDFNQICSSFDSWALCPARSVCIDDFRLVLSINSECRTAWYRRQCGLKLLVPDSLHTPHSHQHPPHFITTTPLVIRQHVSFADNRGSF